MTSMGMASTTVFDAVGPRPSIRLQRAELHAPGLSRMV